MKTFKQAARNASAALALSLVAVSVQAAYTPAGVQNDVDYNSVLNGGWNVVYQGAYNVHAVSISSIFDSIAAGSKVMLAAKHIASSVFDVLAWTTKEDVLQYTAENQTHQSNGAEWYFNGYSMGFAGLGDSINQTTADTNGSAWNGTPERDRLSWHTSLDGNWNNQDAGSAANYIDAGWRSGSTIELNDAQDWQRYVLVFNDNIAPVPEPETYAMLLAGLGLIGAAARRRKAQAAA